MATLSVRITVTGLSRIMKAIVEDAKSDASATHVKTKTRNKLKSRVRRNAIKSGRNPSDFKSTFLAAKMRVSAVRSSAKRRLAENAHTSALESPIHEVKWARPDTAEMID